MNEGVLRMLVKSYSLRKIAAMTEMGLSTIRYWVRKYNIELPERPRSAWDPFKFAEAVKDNITIAGVLRSMGKRVTPSNYRIAHRMVDELGLYTGHWKGQAHGTSRPCSSTAEPRPLDPLDVGSNPTRGAEKGE